MAKFAGTKTKSRGTLLGTTGEKTATHEGGIGFVREPQAELYLTAVSTTLEPTFYESPSDRENRLRELVRQVTLEDPQWVRNFVEWLRGTANMRSVSILVAAEFVKARLDAGISETPEVGARTAHEDDVKETASITAPGMPGLNRQVINAAILRADEPGEFIAYWQTRYGRNLPMPVKRDVADAARKVFNQRAALRYDGGRGAMRLGDVIELVHPAPNGPEQSALFGWLLDRRHGRRETPAAELGLLKQVVSRKVLNDLSIEDRHAFARQVLAGEPDPEFVWLQALAGQWEWGKSWLGQDAEDRTFDRVSEADQWKLFVQHGMGYMAMLRNLRNFDEAGIDNDLQMHVKGVLTSEEEVQRSRQLPFRFYSAFKATEGNHWARALSAGLQHSLANVPSLGGKSLILVDMSGSMFYGASGRGSIQNSEIAALFGSAVALRAEAADLVQYGSGSAHLTIDKGKSVLDHMAKFTSMGGTQTMDAVRTWYKSDHDRVIIVTDEQSHYDRLGGGLDTLVPAEVPTYVWNLVGYRAATMESGPNRHTFGGLTDASWGLIPQIETGVEQNWPWET